MTYSKLKQGFLNTGLGLSFIFWILWLVYNWKSGKEEPVEMKTPPDRRAATDRRRKAPEVKDYVFGEPAKEEKIPSVFEKDVKVRTKSRAHLQNLFEEPSEAELKRPPPVPPRPKASPVPPPLPPRTLPPVDDTKHNENPGGDRKPEKQTGPRIRYAFGFSSSSKSILFLILCMVSTAATLIAAISLTPTSDWNLHDKFSIGSAVFSWIFVLPFLQNRQEHTSIMAGLSLISILNVAQFILAQQDVDQAWINRLAGAIVIIALIVIVKLSRERHFLFTLLMSAVTFLNTVHIIMN